MKERDESTVVYSWDGPPKITLRTKVVSHNNREWLQHILENGSSDGVGVVVIATHRGKHLLNYHYRPTFDQYLIEYPKGYGSASSDETEVEKSLDDGRRELFEETGFTAKRASLIGYIYPDVGVMNSKVAVIAVEVDTKNGALETDGEVDETYWIPSAQMRKMITRGEIRDGLTLAAFSLWREFHDSYSSERYKKESFCEYIDRTLI